MEITWLGHSCFRIKGKAGTIITDPFEQLASQHSGKITADIVTVSHDHPGHNCVSCVSGTPKVITGPGEYEIGGVFIYGVRTFHDSEKGKARGKNTCYLIEIDDIKVCHLGDLAHLPSAQQADEMSDLEVLLLPVGGGATADASAAVEIVNLLGPSLVIPMHYRSEGLRPNLDPVETFLKEMGVKDIAPIPKISVSKTTLPLETQVVILESQR